MSDPSTVYQEALQRDQERKRRQRERPQSDADRLIGSNGGQASGAEFVQVQNRENARLNFEGCLRSLSMMADKVATRTQQAEYEKRYFKLEQAAAHYSRLAEINLSIPGFVKFVTPEPVAVGSY